MVNEIEGNEVKTNVDNRNRFAVAMNSNIFNILSSKIYERPIEAIVREIFSNAIDANIEAGRKDGIYVHLPTETEQYFSVADSGIGMDDEHLQKVFFEYGNSTKSGSNDQIGGFGIGAKTPFAYTNQFTIESSKNGVKTTYIAMKDEDDCPSHTEPIFEDCGDKTGTTITVPVELTDIPAFYNAANKVFLFSKEMPKLNAEAVSMFLENFNEHSSFRDKCDTIEDFMELREHNKTSDYARGLRLTEVLLEMGGVLYTIDNEIIDSDMRRLYKKEENILIHLNVGDVSPQASREKLNYTKSTITKIKETVAKVFEDTINTVAEFVQRTDVKIMDKVIMLEKYTNFPQFSRYIDVLLNKE